LCLYKVIDTGLKIDGVNWPSTLYVTAQVLIEFQFWWNQVLLIAAEIFSFMYSTPGKKSRTKFILNQCQ
jgi:hypothetical protein